MFAHLKKQVMNKVLLVSDGLHSASNAFNFINRINAHYPVTIAGAFLPRKYVSNWTYALPEGGLYQPPIDAGDAYLVNSHVRDFKEHCRENNISFRVHRELYREALPALKLESRFADLMFLCGEDFYNDLTFNTPSDYMRDILHGAECPVILVPEQANYPESVVLAYDGSRASAYAIRQFANLCPQWKQLPVYLVYVASKGTDEIPYEIYIREHTATHFPSLSTYRLTKDDHDDFAKWLSGPRNPILVTGAFGRSGFSELFHRSFAASMAAGKKIPLFIAHP